MKSDKKELIYECSYKNMREFGKTRWLDIPEMGISSELSCPDDIFWNSEKLAEHTSSIIDGLTIANGLKIIDNFFK